MRELFSGTYKPAKVYYRSAQGILALARETEPEIFLLACKVAIRYGKCNYPFIGNLVKSRCQGYLALQEKKDETQEGIIPLHANIRGAQAYK